MAETRFKHFVTLWSIPLDRAMRDHLPSVDSCSQVALEEIERALFPGGKRLAGLSVLAAGRAVGAGVEELLILASAFEYLYSATHLDLEPEAASALAARAKRLISSQPGLEIADLAGGFAFENTRDLAELTAAALLAGATASRASSEQLDAIREISLLAALKPGSRDAESRLLEWNISVLNDAPLLRELLAFQRESGGL